ncbi:WxL domain-containing protein [Lactiplantibacillus fabifermentans]|uniref:WxL domain-containing protein n=2 Tax=Lactiplantibacillus fabifermentans TaxID=483011 RepID=A0A0R2NNH2_9LACO|nr:WxL domain-containing protein [Lactiplantibacillus fabifermentans]ETY72913.1 cell surface protein [Lactiplantibacillus fabifermentans T30PCM01]KRO27288.1 hypothetical protein DY78_GL000139 [Lactiplantibacillus fabifermentans DSM 21115]
MKKYLGTLLAGVTLMAVLPIAAQAADDDQNKSTTADITLEQDTENSAITLDSAPNIHMGTQENTHATKTYEAESIDGNLQVTNPGNTTGWNVTVARTAFETTTGTEMKGAQLNLTNGKVAAVDSENTSTFPATENLEVTTVATKVLTAQTNEGIGAFTLTHDADNVSLKVPAGTVSGAYKSTLTWSLTNAPS